jgi:uncharacterized protein (TIGR02453 family)
MFPGFPPEALKFLRSLKRNNKREWFQARKEIFDIHLRAPMEQLVEAINAELLKFAPEHITDPKKAIYRIYRDTRFSPDKTPYKTHIAAIFPRRGLDRHTSAGFYFHLSPEETGVATGLYQPGKEELLGVRTWMQHNHERFRKASRAPEKLLGKLHGDSLTRTPKGFDSTHPADDLVRMKSWLYWMQLKPELAETPKLLPQLIQRFRAAAAVVEMLNTPLRNKQVKGRKAMLTFE